MPLLALGIPQHRFLFPYRRCAPFFSFPFSAIVRYLGNTLQPLLSINSFLCLFSSFSVVNQRCSRAFIHMFDNQLSQFPSVFPSITYSSISILNPVYSFIPSQVPVTVTKRGVTPGFFKYGVIRRIGEGDKLHCILQVRRVIFEFRHLDFDG